MLPSAPGRGVAREQFPKLMHELGAVAEAEWTHYNIYDPVHGELLEQYLNWRRPDGDLAGRIEEYYAHGETFELYVIFDDEHPDTAHRPR